MASLRKKIFSISQNKFIEIQTGQGLDGYTPVDVNPSFVDAETIRTVSAGEDVDSQRFGHVVSDLIFNDEQVEAEAKKVSRILTEGFFREIEEDFEIEVLDTVVVGPDTYLTKFAMFDGQVKIDDDSFLKTSTELFLVGDIASGDATVSNIPSTLQLTVGMQVRGQGIPLNTTIASITDTTTIELDKTATETLTAIELQYRDDVVFEVGVNIDDITTTGVTYPRWRRDSIEIDKAGAINVVKGPESSVRLPVNTQLDSEYLIDSITNISGNEYQLAIRTTNRVSANFANDFVVGESVELRYTTAGYFDGTYEVLSTNPSEPYTVNIEVPERQGATWDQADPAGIVWLNAITLKSILVTRASLVDPTVIVDEIETVANEVGLSGSLQHIVKDELTRDSDGLWGVASRERVHLRNDLGQLLDWEHGQSLNVQPLIALTNNEDDIQTIDETQLPFSGFEPIANGTLTTFPFKIDFLPDNLFKASTVDLAGVRLGVKNEIAKIGDEGVEVELATVDAIWDISDEQQATNSSPSTTTLVDSGYDFTVAISGYTIVPGQDYVLITGGAGEGQIGKITAAAGSNLTLSGITKPIDNTSTYTIFKALTETSPVTNSNKTITNAQLKSQVLSGTYGRFGDNNEYSKVYLEFDDVVTIQLNKWYFTKVKGNNEGVTWGALPFIVIEKPEPLDVGDNGKRNGFFEILYDTIAGIYPSGAFLIEDEFGDLATEYPDRAKAPHFRPTIYQVVARALDLSGIFELAVPPQDDVVYVDVHTGRVRFRDGAEPRRLYITYYKKDALTGNAAEAVIKRRDPETFQDKTLQGHLNEIDNRFEKGTTFKKSSRANGITPYDDEDVKGPFVVNSSKPNELIYVEPTQFDNHDVDEDKYTARLSRGKTSDIVSVKDGALIVRSNQDYSSSVLNDTLKTTYTGDPIRPSVNYLDEAIFPSEENISTPRIFKRKLFDSTTTSPFEFIHDSTMLDTNLATSVDGVWNNIYFSEYKRDLLMNALLSKASYYSTLDYVFNSDVLSKVREREIVKVFEETLLPVEGQGASKVVYEKFLSKNDISKDGRQFNGEHFIYPYTEVVKTREWKPIKSADVVNETIHTGNVLIHDSIHTSDQLVTVLADPGNSNRPRLFIYPTTKTSGADEYKTYDTWGVASVDLTFTNAAAETTLTPANEAITAVKLVPFDDTKFFILYTYNDGVDKHVEGSLHYYSNGERVDGSAESFSQGGAVDSQYRIGAALVKEGTIAVSWKSSSITTYVSVYTFDTLEGTSAVSDEVILTSEDIVENPKIAKFSRDSFVVAFSYSGSLRVRKYSTTGDPEFFDTALTIDFLELSSDTVSNGYEFNLIEIPSTNDILFVYTEDGTGGGLLSTKLVTLAEYQGTLGSPITIIKDVAEAARPNNFTLSLVYNDLLCITYINDADEIQQKLFNLDLSPCYNTRIETGVTDRTLVKSVQSSDNSNFVIYNEAGSNLRTDLIEIRPDFDSYIEDIGTELEVFPTGGYDAVALTAVDTETAMAYIAPGAPQTIELNMVNALPKEGLEIVSSYGTHQIFDGALGDPVEITMQRLNWVGSNTTVNALVAAYVLGSPGSQSIRMTVVTVNSNGTFTQVGQATIDGGSSSTFSNLTLLPIVDEKVLVSYLDEANGQVTLNNLSFHELDSLSPTITVGQAIGTDAIQITTPVTSFEKPRLIKTGRLNQATLFYADYDSGTGGHFNIESLTVDADLMDWIGDGDASNLADQSGATTIDTFTVGDAGTSVDTGMDAIAIEEDEKIVIVWTSATSFKAAFLTIGSPTTALAFASGWSITGQTLDTPAACVEETIRVLRNIADDAFSIYFQDGTSVRTQTWSFEDPTFGNLDKLQSTYYELESTAVAASDFDVINTDLLATDQIAITKSVSGAGLITKSFKILPINEPLTQERLWEETDPDSVTTIKTYSQETLRIGGTDFQGNVIPPFDIVRFPTYDLTDEFAVTSRTHTSLISGINVVMINKNRFTVVYNSAFNQANNKIFMQHFILQDGRIYEDSEVLESANFDFSSVGFDEMDLFATESADGDNVVITYRVPGTATGAPRVAVVDDTMSLVGATTTPYSLPEVTAPLSNEILRILAFEKQIGGYIATLIYDETNDVYWTHLLRDDVEIHVPPDYFSISLYDRGVDEVSDVKVDKFGHYYVTYIDSGDLKYHQFGMNGDKWGLLQILGKSEFTTAASQSIAVNNFQLPKLSQVNEISRTTKILAGTTDFPTNSSIGLKVIEIGAWNMDTTASVSVAHNIDYTKIINTWAIIVNDAASLRTKLVAESSATTANESSISTDVTNVILNRTTTGIFDAAGYSAGGNRGWIFINYID